MRIGELLIQQQKLRSPEVNRAIAEQSHTGKRLCSLLIARGLLDFDDAARALSAQKRVPCALAKHLDGRSLDAVSQLPPELGRESCALPIGNTRAGELIVCVRDPSPQLLAALEQAAGRKVMMVVAPASKLESLVDATYGASGGDDFEVELGSIPQTPPLPNMDMLDPDSMRMALADLDDVRVEKDPSQSGQLVVQIARTTTPVIDPARRPSAALRGPAEPDLAITPVRAPTPPRVTLPPVAPTLEQTRLALARATSRDAATDHAVAYLAGRWVASLVLALRGTAAIGYRGHNVAKLADVSLPIGDASTVQRAIETRRTSIERSGFAGPRSAAAGRRGESVDSPGGAIQALLAGLVGNPPEIAAAPVLVDGHVVAVIVVGASISGPSDQEDAVAALGHVATALGLAYTRILHG